MNNELLERIKTRKEKLEKIKFALKDKFIGIDDVIDKVIDYISLWYLTPELQFRPLIISLWGITGVGKTDLVRTLVKLLNFTDKFVEIQMDNKNEYSRNIENYLDSSGVDTSQPSILLLDEIQRYRTINEDGKLLDVKHFNDIWMLLSDGKLQSNSQRRSDITEMLLEEMYWLDHKSESKGDETASDVEESSDQTKKDNLIKEKRTYRYSTSYWTAIRMKKLLGLRIPTDTLMSLSCEERIKLLEDCLKSDSVNEGKSYEKLLIFISGNLDEAFKMADEVQESERDADVYHELSKRINIIHIKDALALKFKPEQIARFGNNHVIYPCLNKKSYDLIIKKNCNQIIDKIYEDHNIKITLSNNIFDVIYRNGVFPTQGVRPAISTVFNILGSNLPHFLYISLINDINEFYLDIKDNFLFTNINKKEYKKEIVLDIDIIRQNRSIDEKMLITVHEIGHALIYSILFKTPPKQININSAGFEKGFVINHTSVDNKTFLKNQIAIFLGGLVAEEMVFGEEFKSTGSGFDIQTATHIAGLFVRAYGMDGNISRITKKETQNTGEYNYDVDKTNDLIENLLTEEKKRSKDILNKNLKLYKEIIKFAIDNNGITIEEFFNICNRYDLNLELKDINDKLIYSYDNKIKHFLNQ